MPITRTITLEPGHVAVILHHAEAPVYIGPGTANSDEAYSTSIVGRALYRIAEDPTGQTTMESAVIQIMREDGAGEDAIKVVVDSYAKNFDFVHDGGSL